MGAIGVACVAAAATVEDELMAELGPVVLRDEFHEVLLDLFGIGFAREAEAVGEAAYVGVHDDADVDVEGVAEDDVGGLAADPVEGGEFLHCFGDIAAVVVDEFAAGGLDVLRLRAVEADAANVFSEFGGAGVRVIGSGLVFLEEFFGDDVHLFIGALGGKDGGDEEFQRVGVVQLAIGIGIDLMQHSNDLLGAGVFGGEGLARHGAQIV